MNNFSEAKTRWRVLASKDEREIHLKYSIKSRASIIRPTPSVSSPLQPAMSTLFLSLSPAGIPKNLALKPKPAPLVPAFHQWNTSSVQFWRQNISVTSTARVQPFHSNGSSHSSIIHSVIIAQTNLISDFKSEKLF